MLFPRLYVVDCYIPANEHAQTKNAQTRNENLSITAANVIATCVHLSMVRPISSVYNKNVQGVNSNARQRNNQVRH